MTTKELREIMDIQFTAARAEAKASYDLASMEFRALHNLQMQKMEEIICHQDKANGKLEKHENTLYGIKEVHEGIIRETKPVRWAQKNPGKAAAYIIGGIIVIAKIAQLIPIEKIPVIKIFEKLLFSMI